jgi:vancomycin resistance protein YoaR
VTLGELGIELDVSATMRNVLYHSGEGSLARRLYKAREARRGNAEIAPVWSFHAERARSVLAKLAPAVRVAPVDARLDLVEHRRIDDQPGIELDVEATLAALSDGDREELAILPIATRDVEAKVTSAVLAKVDVSKVLGSFETEFAGTGRGRAVNIGRAAELLNGLVLAPGQTLSFNQLVGPRRIDRGFAYAPEIVADEMEMGVGGGVCQVATTVHAASVFSGLEIVERRSHSRPSAYASLGLDATVIYGEVDLKIRNGYDSPLILHAFLPGKGKLRVELLGRDALGKVEHSYAVTKTENFYRRVTTKPGFDPGKRVKKQRGHKGYDVVSTVRVLLPDGSVRQHHYFSKYHPVPEVFWVGPGVATDELGELPKGASHVEVDGALDVSSVSNPYAQGG